MKLLMFSKKTRSFHMYQMSSDEDYFYIHPYSVILGMLGATTAILLFLVLAIWIAHEIW